MATKIKIVTAKDFLQVTPEGIINLATSKQLLIDIAKADQPPADYELFVDFRDTESNISITDVYNLARELLKHDMIFRRKVALLVLPGIAFDRAHFFETCTRNQGFLVNAFTDYEQAMRWVLSTEDLPDNNTPPNKRKIYSRKTHLISDVRRN